MVCVTERLLLMMSQYSSWSLFGDRALIEHDAAIHEYMSDSLWSLWLLAEVGTVNDNSGVKDHNVSSHPNRNLSAVGNPESTGRFGCHLANGIGELEHAAVTHVPTKYPRKRAEVARVRSGGRLMEWNRIAVGTDNSQRMAEKRRHVSLDSIKEHDLNLVSVLFAQT
jgi:hypothetical protein